jgi:hypothetical protein
MLNLFDNPVEKLIAGFPDHAIECYHTTENGTILAVYNTGGPNVYIISNRPYNGASIGVVLHGYFEYHKVSVTGLLNVPKIESQGYLIAHHFSLDSALGEYHSMRARLTLTPLEIRVRRQVKKAWDAAEKANRQFNAVSFA